MEPTIVEKGPIILVGFSFFGDPFATSSGWTEENEIGRLWSRFITYITQHSDRVKHVTNPGVGYEVHVMHAETAEKGHYEVFVGMEVTRLEDAPVELVVKILPSTQYAVLTLRGEQIISDWARTIYHEWMPAMGYQEAYPFMFELYDQRFKGLERLEESVVDFYIPVKLADPSTSSKQAR